MLNKLDIKQPFMLSKFQNEDSISLLSGNIVECDRLDEIRNFRTKKDVILLPFSSASEKYDFIKDYGRRIIVMNVMHEGDISIKDAISHDFIRDTCQIDNMNFIQSDEEYIKAVDNVIQKEINNGEGSNFMICLKSQGVIKDFSLSKALGLFLRLIKNEYGAYHIFCFFTGKDFFIGASPECHLNVSKDKVDCNRISGTFKKENSLSRIRMQPISGTFRKNDDPINIVKNDILDFLRDKKEINELFMTIDEELKMMAKICPFGGKIIGPRLREMSKVIHTEYLLSGHTDMNIYDVIRDSLHAATLVGSPIENAFRITQKYNNFDKEYYGSLIGILDENDNFDSSITIRTMRIGLEGDFGIFAGASIVKDSIPENELRESKAKMSSMLYNLSNYNENMTPKLLDYFQFDHDICEALQERNKDLSHFWFFDKSDRRDICNNLNGKKVLIIDNEDSFTEMLKHILNKIGLVTDVLSYKNCDINNINVFDLVIVGPGPGNPNDMQNQKIAKVFSVVEYLFVNNIPTLGICLGHQIISKYLGLNVVVGKKVMQGEQKCINLFNKDAIVGFYNTFFALKEMDLDDVNFSYDPETLAIYAMRGKRFSSCQFHPESLLTKNGFDIIQSEIEYLLKHVNR